MAAEAAEHAGYHGILCTGMQDRRRAAVMLIFTMSMILLLPSFNIAAGNPCTTRWNALLQRAKTGVITAHPRSGCRTAGSGS